MNGVMEMNEILHARTTSLTQGHRVMHASDLSHTHTDTHTHTDKRTAFKASPRKTNLTILEREMGEQDDLQSSRMVSDSSRRVKKLDVLERRRWWREQK